MTSPQDWECSIAEKVLETMEEGGKTSSSYYVSLQEQLKLCEKKNQQRSPES
jgi:hypothetical protein|tara:strand:+ start:3817 stop:3972 length:156 start_codon:yes stop_codon:yes gene_type:complete